MAKSKSKKKYSKGTQKEVKNEMHRFKKGTAKSGKGGAKVKSKKQAIAIALSKARKKGLKAPKKASAKKKSPTKKKSTPKKRSSAKASSRNEPVKKRKSILHFFSW